MTRKILAIPALVLSVLLGVAAATARAADLRLVEEEEIYIALDKLNAMGLLPGFMANTRPYDMQAVRAAVKDRPWPGLSVPEETAELGRWVAWYSGPLADVRVGISGAYSGDRVVGWNNAGIPTPDGASGSVSAAGRYEPFPWLSADGRVLSQAGGDGGSLTRTDGYSVQVGHKYFSLQGGKITTWYGPGRRGALVLTNNAEQYPGVRLHNPVPSPCPDSCRSWGASSTTCSGRGWTRTGPCRTRCFRGSASPSGPADIWRSGPRARCSPGGPATAAASAPGGPRSRGKRRATRTSGTSSGRSTFS